jgi:ribonuclease HI
LRGQRVYARANTLGQLEVQGGRVEIRYKPTDTKAYQAAARNLEDVDPTPLPEDTCVAAAEAGSRETTSGSKGKGAATTGAPAAAIPKDAVIAYTDGACSGNPGPAGWGAVLVAPDGQQSEGYAYLGLTTNNVAELTAIQAAAAALPDGTRVVIHTDSQYAIGVLSKGWKAKANIDLIAAVKAEVARRKCSFVYVRGHAGIPLNERADELARESIRTRGKSPLSLRPASPATGARVLE